MTFSRVIDISLPLKPGMIAYPGNPEFSAETTPSESKRFWLSRLSFGSHTGTHIDAPRHTSKHGKGVDAFPPEVFVGPCRVLDLTRVERHITVADLQRFDVQAGERLLAKTSNSLRGYEQFDPGFVALEAEAAVFLANAHIALFGIDYLSVQPKGNPDHRSHTALLDQGIVIFEGLDLSKVEPGRYFFVGLPLKLVGLDGAPARALLLA